MTGDQTLALLILTIGAFVAPLLSHRLGLPTAVGEILLGALIATAIGPLTSSGVPGALGFIGFALLMFTAGAEIDFGQIERGGLVPLLVGLAVSAVSLGGGLVIARAVGAASIVGLAGGVISIGIAVAALREAGLLSSRIGQVVLVVGGLGEFASLLALTGLDVLSGPQNGAILGEALKLVGATALAYLLLVLVRALVWWYPEQFARLVEARDPAEVGVRAAFAVMLLFVAAAAALGLEPVLGGFLAGGLFGFIFRDKKALEQKLSTIGYGFLIPFFFIGVGQEIRLGALASPAVLNLAGQVLALTLVTRALATPLLRLAGLSWRQALAVSLFLSAPLTLQVATARLGADLGLLGNPGVTALILTSVASGIVLPTIGRLVAQPRPPVTPRLGRAIVVDAARSAAPVERNSALN